MVSYFETDTEAGVTFADGSQLTADCVFAAEGVRSAGRKAVLGVVDDPKPSGYAVYRAWFSAAPFRDNPRTKHLVEHGDTHYGWIGPDVHFLVATIKDGADVSWVLTHKDEADIDESWSFPGKVEDVLKCLEGWDETCHDIVKATPEDKLVDYKLVYRDPLPTFISPKARIALIGDAAHPFLPTSIQGASQAMEDGVTLAVCLEKAHAAAQQAKTTQMSSNGKAPSKEDAVQTAIRAYEAIRYVRVTRAQGTGVSTREQWHKADWEKIGAHPESLHLKREPWLLDFDAEMHAYAVYDDVVKELESKRKSKAETKSESESKPEAQVPVPVTKDVNGDSGIGMEKDNRKGTIQETIQQEVDVLGA